MRYKLKMHSVKLLVMCLLLFFTSVISFASGDDDTEKYIDQLINNTENSVVLQNTANEYINPFQGNLNLKYVDLSLPGINGMDFNLIRQYNSHSAYAFDIDQGVVTDSQEKVRANIGSGWSFNIPYLKPLPYIDRTAYQVNLGEMGNFLVDEVGTETTQATIKGFEKHNMNFYALADRNECVVAGRQAIFAFKFGNGTKYYFADDLTLMAVRDKNGNQISYEYTVTSNSDNRQPDKKYLISRITDTLGRVINFNYSSTNLVVSVTGEGQTQSITYAFEKFSDITSLKPEIIPSLLTDTDVVLKSVTNSLGMTTSYTYDVKAARKNDDAKTVEGQTKDVLYALVKTINKLGGSNTNYEYITSIRNNGVGATEFFKINRRYDDLSSVVNNNVTYAYAIDAGSEYDGYPTYNDTTGNPLPDNFRVRVSVVNDNSTTEFLADKDLKILETITTTDDLIKKEYKKYDDNDQVISVKSEISEPASSNADMVTVKLYGYDYKGRRNAVWGTQTETTVDADGKYVPSNDEYKTTTIYDDRYNIPTSVTYKQDADTTIEKKNILSSDGKHVTASEVYENGVKKSKVSYTYDSYGNLTSTTTYDKDFNPLNTTHHSYSGTGKNAFVTRSWTDSLTDVDGQTISSIETLATYDYFGNPLTATDGNGHQTSVTYDVLNRPLVVTNADSTTQKLEYNNLSNGFNIIKTDELNNKFKLNYDGLGRLISVVDMTTNDVYVTHEYNHLSQLVKSTDALGNYSITEYYKSGEVKSEKAYSSNDILLSAVNYTREIGVENGEYTTMTTEILGDVNAPTQKKVAYINKHGLNIKNTLFEDGSPKDEVFTYDYVGRDLTFTSARVADENLSVPYSWKKEYDYAGNVIKFYNAKEDFTTSVYNPQGQVIEAYDFKSNKTVTPYASKQTYDDLGRLIKSEVPFEDVEGVIKYTVTEFKYDKNNNVIETRVSNNQSSEAESFSIKKFEYDNRNRLIKVTLFNGSNTPVISQYYYDAVGNKLRMYTGLSSPLTITGLDQVTGSDMDFSVTKYEYNHLGNMIKYYDPMGESETYTYDLNGNLKTRVDRNGTTFTQSYDGLNRNTQTSANNGDESHMTSYQYYQVGLLKEINSNGYIETFEYNDRGLLRKHNYPDYFTQYTYNMSGNVTSLLSMKGIHPIQSADYTYDELDRLTQVSDLQALQATYTYDDNGNRESLKYKGGSFGANYTYNLANKVTLIDNFNDGTVASDGNPLTNVLQDYEYKYKLNGTRVSEKETVSGVMKTYAYDEINRLVNESKQMNGHVPEALDTQTGSEDVPDLLSDYSINYTYDDYGNIKEKVDGDKTTTYTYDKNNRIISESVEDANAVTTKKFIYDKNGNTISERTEVYSKTAGDLGSSIYEQAKHIKVYEYNILNQQIKATTSKGRTTYTYNASGLRATKTKGIDITTFFWDGQNIIGEDKNGTITANYLYGLGLIRKEDVATHEKLYYFFNGHGDVVALTDDTGEVVTVYDYNAYGEFTTRGADKDNPFTYFGQYYDDETGTFYLRARYYNPGYMRFTQEDSYTGTSDDPLSLNRYLYCVGNPVLYIDITGRSYTTNDIIKGGNESYSGDSYERQLEREKYTQIGIDSSTYPSVEPDDLTLFKSTTRMLAKTIIAHEFVVSTTQNRDAKILFWIGGFTSDANSIYYARQDCFQQYGGYNDFYDVVFDYATSMDKAKFMFNYDGEDYILWAWKGNYLNLGAGAELGIYKRLEIANMKTEHWLVDTDLAMPMTITIMKNNRVAIANYLPEEKQWWITSFNPNHQGISAGELTVRYTIDFSENIEMYNAFRNSDVMNDNRWDFNDEEYTAEFNFN